MKKVNAEVVVDELGKLCRQAAKLNLYITCAKRVDWILVEIQLRMVRRQLERSRTAVKNLNNVISGDGVDK